MKRKGNSFQWNPITDKGIARTICAGCSRYTDNYINEGRDRIRKLTPYESLRLMGLSDRESKTICKSAMSDSAIYKLAGNSIVVDVLSAIFGNLFCKNRSSNKCTALGSLKTKTTKLQIKNKTVKKIVNL